MDEGGDAFSTAVREQILVHFISVVSLVLVSYFGELVGFFLLCFLNSFS